MKKKIILIVELLIVHFSLITFHSFSQAPAWVWAKTAGSLTGDLSDDDESQAIVTDASGNSYITGFFVSPKLNFGSLKLINSDTTIYPPTYDIFLAKYDLNGNILWAKSFGGANDDKALAMARDDSGYIYITGYSLSPKIIFGKDTLTNNNSSLFLVKFDSDGNVIWAKNTGNNYDDGTQLGTSLAVDSLCNVYLTGYFTSTTITFGNITFQNPYSYEEDMFMAKFDYNGNVLWAKNPGAVGNPPYVAVDHSGNAIFAGEFGGPISFDTITLTNISYVEGMFLAKCNTNGKALWAFSLAGDLNENVVPNSVLTDASGNISVAGLFNCINLKFDSTITLHGVGGDQYSMFLAKFNPDGKVKWAKSVGASGGGFYISPNSIALDKSGNEYLTGYCKGINFYFDSDTLTNSYLDNFTDLFVAKFDANGKVLWAENPAGEYNDYGTGIAINTAGYVLITGYYDSPSLTFGSLTLNNITANSEENDIFLASSYEVISGIEHLNIEDGQYRIYPNPANSLINISRTYNDNNPFNISFYDVTGRNMFDKNHILNKTEINCSGFNDGIYILKIYNDKSTFIRKVIISK